MYKTYTYHEKSIVGTKVHGPFPFKKDQWTDELIKKAKQPVEEPGYVYVKHPNRQGYSKLMNKKKWYEFQE